MLRAVGSRLATNAFRLASLHVGPADRVAAAYACGLRCLFISAPQLQQAEPAQQPEPPHAAASKQQLTPYNPDEGPGADSTIVHKHGADLLHDCVHNKVQRWSSANPACNLLAGGNDVFTHVLNTLDHNAKCPGMAAFLARLGHSV